MLNLGFPRVNRGVAIDGDTVFVGTLDGYLVALDARAGVERWSVHVGENPTGHAITAAPLVVDGKVIVGISGGEAGIRGFLDAYDVNTGKQAWRFWTVPSPGEPGSESWPGDSWVHGGGATWLTGSYDPELKLLYWGTGNPGPDWNGDSRKGDNLYTSSLVAIDVETGKARWHFQFTPHDVHDWDANQIPVLVDTRGRRPHARARRHRQPQRIFLRARSQDRRVRVRQRRTRSRRGRRGSTTRAGRSRFPTWSRRRKARWSIQACRDRPTGRARRTARPRSCCTCRCAKWDRSTTRPALSTSPARTTPAAARSGSTKNRGAPFARSTSRPARQVWDFKLPSPPWAGVMSTAGGLVFGGSNEGNFFALDAKTGKPLWQFQTGGAIRSGPMSYLAGGKQHVAVAGGHTLFVFAI